MRMIPSSSRCIQEDLLHTRSELSLSTVDNKPLRSAELTLSITRHFSTRDTPVVGSLCSRIFSRRIQQPASVEAADKNPATIVYTPQLLECANSESAIALREIFVSWRSLHFAFHDAYQGPAVAATVVRWLKSRVVSFCSYSCPLPNNSSTPLSRSFLSKSICSLRYARPARGRALTHPLSSPTIFPCKSGSPTSLAHQ